MLLKRNMLRGVVVFMIYLLVTMCLFFAADRIERMDKETNNIDKASSSYVKK